MTNKRRHKMLFARILTDPVAASPSAAASLTGTDSSSLHRQIQTSCASPARGLRPSPAVTTPSLPSSSKGDLCIWLSLHLASPSSPSHQLSQKPSRRQVPPADPIVPPQSSSSPGGSRHCLHNFLDMTSVVTSSTFSKHCKYTPTPPNV